VRNQCIFETCDFGEIREDAKHRSSRMLTVARAICSGLVIDRHEYSDYCEESDYFLFVILSTFF